MTRAERESAEGPTLPDETCWFCGSVKVDEPVEESLVHPNRVSQIIQIPTCRLCGWIYLGGLVVGILGILLWLAALLILHHLYVDEIWKPLDQIPNKLLQRLLFGCVFILAAITCVFAGWLTMWGFRYGMFFLRGASHADIGKYPEIAALVGAGYYRRHSLVHWLAEIGVYFGNRK
jgi:hypothetical protein